jgi:hypothetical protein
VFSRVQSITLPNPAGSIGDQAVYCRITKPKRHTNDTQLTHDWETQLASLPSN